MQPTPEEKKTKRTRDSATKTAARERADGETVDGREILNQRRISTRLAPSLASATPGTPLSPLRSSASPALCPSRTTRPFASRHPVSQTAHACRASPCIRAASVAKAPNVPPRRAPLAKRLFLRPARSPRRRRRPRQDRSGRTRHSKKKMQSASRPVCERPRGRPPMVSSSHAARRARASSDPARSPPPQRAASRPAEGARWGPPPRSAARPARAARRDRSSAAGARLGPNGLGRCQIRVAHRSIVSRDVDRPPLAPHLRRRASRRASPYPSFPPRFTGARSEAADAMGESQARAFGRARRIVLARRPGCAGSCAGPPFFHAARLARVQARSP